jgi:hypothetical protein
LRFSNNNIFCWKSERARIRKRGDGKEGERRREREQGEGRDGVEYG